VRVALGTGCSCLKGIGRAWRNGGRRAHLPAETPLSPRGQVPALRPTGITMALATLHALCAMGGSPVEAAAASSGAGGGATPMDTDAEEPEAKEKAAAALLPECISNVSRMVETMLAHHETARLFVERGGMAVMLRLYSLPALAPTLASSAATQVPTPVPVPYTGRADAMMRPSSARAEMTAPPKLGTSCTALSLIPTVNGNTVRSFSTHGQQSAAKGSTGLFDFSALVWSGGGAYLAISLSYITTPPLPLHVSRDICRYMHNARPTARADETHPSRSW
jgi:hypothetical protein